MIHGLYIADTETTSIVLGPPKMVIYNIGVGAWKMLGGKAARQGVWGPLRPHRVGDPHRGPGAGPPRSSCILRFWKHSILVIWRLKCILGCCGNQNIRGLKTYSCPLNPINNRLRKAANAQNSLNLIKVSWGLLGPQRTLTADIY